MPSSSSFTRKEIISMLVCLLVFFLPFFVTFPGLSSAGHRLLAVFLLAIVLWVTELIPLFATSALVIFLQVLLISDASAHFPWGVADGFKGAVPTYGSFMNALSSPVLLLFLGGFFLAFGASKFGLDRNLASLMLRPFGDKPSRILLGLMLITGFLSMWMSNTATCATIMAVILPLIHRLEPGDKFRTALALGVPFAANIGGIGTPVGTPPNAIALAALKGSGTCNFSQWMIATLPLTLVLLVICWLVLVFLFRPQAKTMEISMKPLWIKNRSAWIFYVTAILTILLWVTENLHGINSYIVGLVPVVVLLATKVVGVEEFQGMDWHILWLLAGGIALGDGVGKTGFDTWLVGFVDWGSLPGGSLLVLLAAAGLVLGTFISHSAATNILAPMGIAVALSTHTSAVAAAMAVAVGSSLAMALPISTPPNAIAMSTGAVKTKDMALAGIIVSVIGVILMQLFLPFCSRLAGLP